MVQHDLRFMFTVHDIYIAMRGGDDVNWIAFFIRFYFLCVSAANMKAHTHAHYSNSNKGKQNCGTLHTTQRHHTQLTIFSLLLLRRLWFASTFNALTDTDCLIKLNKRIKIDTIYSLCRSSCVWVVVSTLAYTARALWIHFKFLFFVNKFGALIRQLRTTTKLVRNTDDASKLHNPFDSL